MNTAILMNFVVDKDSKQIKVEREFDAPLPMVWAAWTQAELLDQWWAPKPWQAKTKSLDFRPGGSWLYAMIGPEGEIHWSKADFKQIEPLKHFSTLDAFCDENGMINPDWSQSLWENTFSEKGDSTFVNIVITYDKLADLEKMVDMGFKEGFTAGLENLDLYLSTQFSLRKQNKTTNRARVTTYLNFPGKTEEAFNFYKTVFKGEFTGVGLKRFGEIDMPEGTPPMSNADKKLIIHAELTIMGGHVLMATDAPESMGFTMTYGNNMHVNLEPETREETDRLFNELSEGGTVSMTLQDMPWGAYFASFQDKYGINWMLNFQAAE